MEGKSQRRKGKFKFTNGKIIKKAGNLIKMTDTVI